MIRQSSLIFSSRTSATATTIKNLITNTTTIQKEKSENRKFNVTSHDGEEQKQ